jgi:hypothetical protein
MAGGRHGRDARQRTCGEAIDGEKTPDLGDTDWFPDLVDEITWYMREHKVSRTGLAGAMGVPPGRVSMILSGDERLTSRTFASILAALDARAEITLQPAHDRVPA